MIRFITGLLVSFVFLVLIDYMLPGTVCDAIERTKGIMSKEQTIIVEDDTLFYNKKTKEYEYKSQKNNRERN